ncbi:unnamed protein product [Penicillium salamii]|uniref:Uncharacterized protein n=1 Tax=Penicillium salamii TaxID=1612424 RepID=A0A9W4IIN2_9EURO|nr:unnamed protein product [Penicillium salamii]CAG8103596.1 unnamed protein product [Penicillium salamii]CAG8290670.1 unnamed protein product [Penicillium salamii]CAG8387540.1 unnamed protein product [Penicillium salamii]
MKVSPFAQTIAASQKQSLFGKPSLPPSPFDLPNRQPSFGSIASPTTELTVPGTFGTHSSLFGPGAGFKVAETPGAPKSLFGPGAGFKVAETPGAPKSLFGPGAGIGPGSGLTAPVAETPGAPKSLFGTGTTPAPEGNKPSLFGPGAGTGTTDSSSSLFGRSSSVAPQSTDVAKSHSLFGPSVGVIHVYKLLICLFFANTSCTAQCEPQRKSIWAASQMRKILAVGNNFVKVDYGTRVKTVGSNWSLVGHQDISM